jgi:hypothetical protein
MRKKFVVYATKDCITGGDQRYVYRWGDEESNPDISGGIYIKPGVFGDKFPAQLKLTVSARVEKVKVEKEEVKKKKGKDAKKADKQKRKKKMFKELRRMFKKKRKREDK